MAFPDLDEDLRAVGVLGILGQEQLVVADRPVVPSQQELFFRQEEKLNSNKDAEQVALNQTTDRLETIKQELKAQKNNLIHKQKNIENNREVDGELSDSLEKLQTERAELAEQKEKSIHQTLALENVLKKEIGTWETVEIPGSLGLLADLIESDAEFTPAIDFFWREEAHRRRRPSVGGSLKCY